MTGTYDWNPMPHKLDIKCPACSQRAEFEFAEVCRIKLNTDVDFFKNSTSFEYRKLQDSCGHYWHGALYYAGLHGDPCDTVNNLPMGYKPSDWQHSEYLYRSQSLEIGSVRCEHCHLRKKHSLKWPDDAYFSIAHRNKVLWAFHRDSAYDLNDYLLSKSRDPSKYRWRSFLLHVPTIFKTEKARVAISKQFMRLLKAQ
jgi:hypothetical protein